MVHDVNAPATLPRVFSLHHYLSLSLGYAVGLGWIFVPARMLARGGPLVILLAILLSGALLWSIAQCYKLLIATNPAAGGEIAFARRFVGAPTAFAVFWLLLLGYLSYLLFYTSFAGVIFESLTPELGSANIVSVGTYQLRWSAALSGLLLGGIVITANCFGTRAAINLQSCCLLLAIVLVAIVAVTAFASGTLENAKPVLPPNVTWIEVPGLLIVVTGMICWYLFGFSTVALCAAESSEDGGTSIPALAVGLSLLLTVVFYLIVHAFIIVALPCPGSRRRR